MQLNDRRPVYFALLLLIASSLFTGLWHHMALRLVMNLTPSIPKGIYQIVPFRLPQKTTLIAFNLPGQARSSLGPRPWLSPELPLIKPIGAIPGDRVCVSTARITVNAKPFGSVYQADYLGQPIPMKTGCYTVPANQVLPISTYNDRSFDGRYFGPIEIKDIIGEAIPVFTW